MVIILKDPRNIKATVIIFEIILFLYLIWYCVSCVASGSAGSSSLRVTGLCRTRRFSFVTSSLKVALVNTA
jgi:hypothetical protein